MTKFSQLELIYNQFVNLSNELNTLIEDEEYDYVIEKLPHKDKLIKKLLNAKKTANLTKEENEKIELIEKSIREKETKTLNNLKKLQDELAIEIKATKSKVKIGSAYAIEPENEHGIMIDISE